MKIKNINVIVTAAGCPGASTFIRYLSDKVTEREVKVIAVDMSNESIGRFLAPVFYKIPSASDPDYIFALKEIIKKENADVLFCVSSFEVPIIANKKEELEKTGAKVIVASNESVETAGNKYKLYKALKNSKSVKIPEYYYPRNLDEFILYAKELGYPKKEICFKPHFSKGSRGFRIINDSISRKDLLLNHKPESLYISMEEFVSIFKNEIDFPAFIIMEFVEGEEIDSMVLAYQGELLLCTCKTRETSRAGVIMTGELVKRPKIVDACKEIIETIPIDYNSGMQFKGGYLIEINTSTPNLINLWV